MRILNKTQRIIMLSGTLFTRDKRSLDDVIQSRIDIVLHPGISEVDKSKFKTVARSYVDALIERDMLEILPEIGQKAEKKVVKETKKCKVNPIRLFRLLTNCDNRRRYKNTIPRVR
jgi:UV DNA damage repair endonuclease